jgi:hypothetical protein
MSTCADHGDLFINLPFNASLSYSFLSPLSSFFPNYYELRNAVPEAPDSTVNFKYNTPNSKFHFSTEKTLPTAGIEPGSKGGSISHLAMRNPHYMKEKN